MLCLTRKHTQWINITDKAGNPLRIQVRVIDNKSVRLVFHDDERNFEIVRPEAVNKVENE